MNRSLQATFRITDAKAVTTGVPANLPALIIAERDPDGPSITICAVGDIGLSGRAAKTIQRGGEKSLFSDVAPVLQSADIAFGNLESPLAGDIAGSNMFAAPSAGATILRESGFNLIHLANNHVGEYGQPGLAATLGAISAAGITPLGAGAKSSDARRLVQWSTKGLNVGWLGCGHTLLSQNPNGEQYWEFAEAELISAIQDARAQVDLLIVSIHMGMMYIDYPRPDHKELAERLMGSGADLILMHHAHVLQGIEVDGCGHACCYNLGNFLYDWQEGNVLVPIMVQEQNEGAIFQFRMDRSGIAQMVVLPTWIDDDCCCRWAVGAKGSVILQRLIRISEDIKGDFAAKFEAQRAQRNMGPILRVLAFHAKRLNWRYLLDAARRVRIEHFRMLLRWLTT